jgi:nitroimidazol reductase NimA-like FMN-containing flavoprotein (pyridoxamine 5'-phosphate oxidase superfamily)
MSVRTSGPQSTTPKADRPYIPGYGLPSSREGILPWEWATERLTRASNYWICTTRPDGRPHAAPVWAVWVDSMVVFEGGPGTRRGRNIAANPAVVVHIESGEDIVIVEGVAEEIRSPEPELEAKLVEAYAKYRKTHGYEADPANWREGGLYLVHPDKVLAWSSFPADATRWTFERDERA